MGELESWDPQSEDYIEEKSCSYDIGASSNSPKNFKPGVTPFRTGPEYKLYVTPIPDEYNMKSLEKIFSVCGEVIEVYISDKKETGFRWAFIYYNNLASAEDAVARFNDHPTYNFRVRFAKEKVKPPRVNNSYVASTDESAVAKDAKANGVSYFTPPNCKTCKKLTAFTCSLCDKPFCNPECSLDGWKHHTGECVKVANLRHNSEKNIVGLNPTCNGTGSQISGTLVSFMRKIRENNENFKAKEFAAVCSDRVAKPTPHLNGRSSQYCDTEQLSPSRSKSLPKADNKFSPRTDNVPSNTAPSVKSSRQSNDGYPKHEQSEPNNKRELTENHIAFKPKKQINKPTFSSIENTYDDDDIDNAPSSRLSRGRNSLNSNKLNGRKEIKETTPATSFNLEVGKTAEALVTVLENNDTFFIAEPNTFFSFMGKMKEIKIAELEPLESIKLNQWCFSFFDDDWYRAKVISLDPLEVLYVDFGNREKTDYDKLRVIPSMVKKQAPLALKVKLNNGSVKDYNLGESEQIVVYPIKYDENFKEWIVDIL